MASSNKKARASGSKKSNSRRKSKAKAQSAEEIAEAALAAAPDIVIADEELDIDQTGKYFALSETPIEEETASFSVSGTAREGETIMSLSRLEEDLQLLHNSWSEIEQRLAEKDDEIAALAKERQVHMAAFRSLQGELEDRLEEYETLYEQLEGTDQKLTDAEASLEELKRTLTLKEAELVEKNSEIQAVEEQRNEARLEAERLRDEMAVKAAEYEHFDKERSGFGEKQLKLKTEIQGLESYIDRRKVDWDKQSSELQQYKDALMGMESSLKETTQIVVARDKVEAELRSQVAELDGTRESLTSKLANEEAARAAVDTEYAAAAAELANLTTQHDATIAELTLAQKQINSQQARITGLEDSVAELNESVQGLRSSTDNELAEMQKVSDELVENARADLSAAKNEISTVNAKVDQLNEQIAGLQADVAVRDEMIQEMRDTKAGLEARLNEAAELTQQLNNKVGTTENEKQSLQNEYREYHEATVAELAARNEQIASLESDLKARISTLDLLDRNAQKLGMIKENVRKLDAKFAQSKQHTPDAQISAKANRLMVAVKGMPNIKFPIYKESMIIGRSRDSDIQVRRRFISREHARLEDGPEGTVIFDLGSKNGVLVNSQAIDESARLKDGDLIDIGEIQFQFVETAEEDDAIEAAIQS